MSWSDYPAVRYPFRQPRAPRLAEPCNVLPSLARIFETGVVNRIYPDSFSARDGAHVGIISEEEMEVDVARPDLFSIFPRASSVRLEAPSIKFIVSGSAEEDDELEDAVPSLCPTSLGEAVLVTQHAFPAFEWDF